MSELTYTPVLVKDDFEDVKNVAMYGKPEKNYELAKQQMEKEEKFIENKNAKKGIMVMRRTIVALVLLLIVACNAQTNIPATVNMTNTDGVVRQHLFVWEGADALANPLVEDSSYTYLDSLGLAHFVIDPVASQFVFQTLPNGNYIQVAGVNEYPNGVFMPAALSELLQKVLYQKMGIILTL